MKYDHNSGSRRPFETPSSEAPLLDVRGTSFVVSFVVAMNRVDVVALNTIFVLRLSKTGRTVGRTDSRLDGWSVGRTDDRSGDSSCL